MPDSSPTPAELLGRADEFSLETGMMRIAPLWTDLNPNPSDRGRVHAGAVGSTEYRISWVNVSFRNVPGKSVTMSLVLRRNGSFQIVYEDVPAIYGDTICGYAAGHEHTNVAGPQSDLSALSGTVGNGTQPHVFEYFLNAFDMNGRTLEFATVLPKAARSSTSCGPPCPRSRTRTRLSTMGWKCATIHSTEASSPATAWRTLIEVWSRSMARRLSTQDDTLAPLKASRWRRERVTVAAARLPPS